MKHHIFFILFLLSTTVISSCGYQDPDPFIFEESAPVTPTENIAETASIPEKSDIYISIQGEVVHPGVYILKSGSRVYEVINMAGGVTDDAQITSINMASILSDGMQIVVPSVNADTADSTIYVDNAASQPTSSLININTANLSELMTLTGIGQTRAQAIIDYRESGNIFKNVEDIMNVAGIKEKTYEGLKDEICVY